MKRFIPVRVVVGVLLIWLIPIEAGAPIPIDLQIVVPREELLGGVPGLEPPGGGISALIENAGSSTQTSVLGALNESMPPISDSADQLQNIAPVQLGNGMAGVPVTTSREDLIKLRKLAPWLINDNPSQFGINEQLLEQMLKGVGGIKNVDQLFTYQQFVGLPIKKEIDSAFMERLVRETLVELKLREHFPPPGEPPTDCPFCRKFVNDDVANYTLVSFDSGYELWTLDSNGLSRSKGKDVLERFHNIARDITAKKSREDFPLVYVSQNERSAGIIDVQFGSRQVKTLRTDLISQLEMLAGTDSTPITILVDGATTDADLQPAHLAIELKRRFRAARDVLIARRATAAYEHDLRFRASSVKGPEDVAVYTASTIEDYRTVSNIQTSLRRAGIAVYDAEEASLPPQETGSPENVIVVTGHRDTNMAAHLNMLKNVGRLKGKFVVVLSCYESGVELAQSTLTSGPNGAIAVIFPSNVITASAVEKLLREFAHGVNSGELRGKRLDHALETAGKAASDKASDNFDLFNSIEIAKILNGMVVQISALQPGFASDNIA